MIRLSRFLIFVPAIALWPCAAHADGDNRGPDREEFALDGSVPPSCRLGQPDSGPLDIELVNLADADGRLRSDLLLPERNLAASFCNSASTLTVTATPLLADGAGRSATGFSRSVDYTVQVAGWTDSPAVFATQSSGAQGTGAQNGSLQSQPRPRQSDINVLFTNFRTTGGSNLRLIAAPRYTGAVVISLSPTP